MTATPDRSAASVATVATLAPSERRGRWYYKAASAWLLMGAGGHLAGHWLRYGELEPLLRLYSLGFGLLLAILGTQNWRLALETPRAVLQRHAWRNGLLFAVAALALLLTYPLPPPLLVCAIASASFTFAGVALRQAPPGYTG